MSYELHKKMKMGTLFEVRPRRYVHDSDETPLFPDPERTEIKIGWLFGNDVLMSLDDTDDSERTKKRIRVISRLGIGWISKMWIQVL